MKTLQLQERARRAGWHARVRRVIAPEIHAQVQPTRPRLHGRQPAGRGRRERARLRRLTPEAQRWTMEVTAQILVARGLDV